MSIAFLSSSWLFLCLLERIWWTMPSVYHILKNISIVFFLWKIIPMFRKKRTKREWDMITMPQVYCILRNIPLILFLLELPTNPTLLLSISSSSTNQASKPHPNTISFSSTCCCLQVLLLLTYPAAAVVCTWSAPTQPSSGRARSSARLGFIASVNASREKARGSERDLDRGCYRISFRPFLCLAVGGTELKRARPDLLRGSE